MKPILVIFAALTVTPWAQASEVRWIGRTGSGFADPNNWNPNSVPNEDDSVIVDHSTRESYQLSTQQHDGLIALDNLQIGIEDGLAGKQSVGVHGGGFRTAGTLITGDEGDESTLRISFSPHGFVSNDLIIGSGSSNGTFIVAGHTDVDVARMVVGQDEAEGIARVENLLNDVRTESLTIAEGNAKGTVTIDRHGLGSLIRVGPEGIRMATGELGNAKIELHDGVLDLTAAELPVFRDVRGTANVELHTNATIRVSGNVHDIQQLSSDVEFMVVGAEAIDYEYNPLTDTTDIFPTPRLGPLSAGDADQDLDFDQLDLVLVQIAGKYLTGERASWIEGDWNGAPGGTRRRPPPGDGLFNQLDLVAALQTGLYLNPICYCAHQSNRFHSDDRTVRSDDEDFASALQKRNDIVEPTLSALAAGGDMNDNSVSLVYHAVSGELAVEPTVEKLLTSITIESTSGVFTGEDYEWNCQVGGPLACLPPNRLVFRATFGSNFGFHSFGQAAEPGLSEEFLRSDLTVFGSLLAGGDLGSVDLVYVPVPEPTNGLLFALGLLALAMLKSVSRENKSSIRDIG